MFLDSSMAEHSAVNRRVVGSSPTRGAFLMPGGRKREEDQPGRFLFPYGSTTAFIFQGAVFLRNIFMEGKMLRADRNAAE